MQPDRDGRAAQGARDRQGVGRRADRVAVRRGDDDPLARDRPVDHAARDRGPRALHRRREPREHLESGGRQDGIARVDRLRAAVGRDVRARLLAAGCVRGQEPGRRQRAVDLLPDGRRDPVRDARPRAQPVRAARLDRAADPVDQRVQPRRFLLARVRLDDGACRDRHRAELARERRDGAARLLRARRTAERAAMGGHRDDHRRRGDAEDHAAGARRVAAAGALHARRSWRRVSPRAGAVAPAAGKARIMALRRLPLFCCPYARPPHLRLRRRARRQRSDRRSRAVRHAVGHVPRHRFHGRRESRVRPADLALPRESRSAPRHRDAGEFPRYDRAQHRARARAMARADRGRARRADKNRVARGGRVEQPARARAQLAQARGAHRRVRRARVQRRAGRAAEALPRCLPACGAHARRRAGALRGRRGQRIGAERRARGRHEDDRVRRREPHSRRL
ncbi:hypothetical protein BURPS1710b_0897 [Burkholderia pseudomallei 1710b]|uniref:Uncharacterized protein n=1 Tax=Burkholderia pseudomallei (strain 1710b) TaxID=320372 RepID=Q3JVU3_BURP1|nr:hypothetical protein BURPS1710b_0897 [Burkholderia pseudomallei 1710b]